MIEHQTKLPPASVSDLLTHLWRQLSSRNRAKIGVLLLLMIVASFAEVVSIGAVLPFLAVLTEPATVQKYAFTNTLIEWLGVSDPNDLLLPFTILFAAAALIAGALRLLLLWLNSRFSYSTGAELSVSMYRRTLYQPYSVHCNRNSSEVINGITNKTRVLIDTIAMSLTMVSSGLMLITILTILFYVDPFVALSAFSGFGLIYLIIIRLTKKKLSLNSECVATESTRVIQTLQEGLGGIRDVLLDGSQAVYCRMYQNAEKPLRRAEGDNVFIANSPRYLMEALGMVLIAILAYSISQRTEQIASAIPILGVFALAAQRLLPVLQQAYVSWTNMRAVQASIKDALDLLDQPLPQGINSGPTNRPISFSNDISLDHIGFKYDRQGTEILTDVTFKIVKGSRIGVIGTTGSGKSTLIDLVMGLLSPTHGSLKIDGQRITAANSGAWQARIAHVPQAIFLADTTVAQNIAFGIHPDEIDFDWVRQVAVQAQIASSIDSWPNKYQTVVGERGVRLSGGQRQRIGIARALYKKADVIIFDEATSALDSETEQAVMDAIEGLDKNLTLLIIAHRVSTLKACSRVIELKQGRIERIIDSATLMEAAQSTLLNTTAEHNRV